MQRSPKILMIGAGAVGQAYGFHLARGGAEVTYFIKEKYREDMANGLVVKCLNGPAKGRHEYTGYGLITELADVNAEHWDQVWLCVSSPALRGQWLPDLVQRVGQATIVMLQPGTDDYGLVTSLVVADRVVHGMITLASYQAPLPGEEDEKAMHWWFPPLSPAPFTGDSTSVDLVTRCLKSGGMAAKHTKDIVKQLRVGSGILMPLMAALEMGGWRLKELRRGRNLALVSRAVRQATQISLPNQRRILINLISLSIVLRLILLIAPKVTPFDLEAMLRVHFTKVGEQTRIMLQRYIEMGRQQEQPHDAVEALLSGISTTH